MLILDYEKKEFLIKFLISMDMEVPERNVMTETSEDYLEVLRHEVADSIRAYTRDHVAEHKSKMMGLY